MVGAGHLQESILHQSTRVSQTTKTKKSLQNQIWHFMENLKTKYDALVQSDPLLKIQKQRMTDAYVSNWTSIKSGHRPQSITRCYRCSIIGHWIDKNNLSAFLSASTAAELAVTVALRRFWFTSTVICHEEEPLTSAPRTRRPFRHFSLQYNGHITQNDHYKD